MTEATTMRGFSLMLPPGWVQFDLTAPVRGPVEEAIGEVLSDIPHPAKKTLYNELVEPITRALTNLAGEAAVAAYLSLENPVSAAILPVISIRPLDLRSEGEPLEPLEYLIALLGSGEVELVEFPGMVGVKRVQDHDATDKLRAGLREMPTALTDGVSQPGWAAALDTRRLARHVEYIIGVPGTEDCWMTVSADISSLDSQEAQEALDAMTDFLDVWVGTMYWHEAKDAQNE